MIGGAAAVPKGFVAASSTADFKTASTAALMVGSLISRTCSSPFGALPYPMASRVSERNPDGTLPNVLAVDAGGPP